MVNSEHHVSRNLDFTDDLKSYHNWYWAYLDSLEDESERIKDYKLDGYLTFLKQFLPNETKIMSVSFLKDVTEIKEHRLLILVSHLYFENFMEEIIKKRLKYSSKILKSTFFPKLKLLYESKIIDDFYYHELRFINALRNDYAHNLNFDILDYNFDKSLILKDLKILKKYSAKRSKRKLYNFVIRMHLIYLLFALSHNYKEIHLLDFKNKSH